MKPIEILTNPAVVAALIGLAGVVFGAILREVLPGSRLVQVLSRKPARHNLRGDWISSWGPLPKGPVELYEKLTISRQRGDEVRGHITRDKESSKRWEVQGRYDGQFLQLLYYPSERSKDVDFLDCGCYFLRRKAGGTFEGYSTGFGESEYDETEGTSTDYHELRRG